MELKEELQQMLQHTTSSLETSDFKVESSQVQLKVRTVCNVHENIIELFVFCIRHLINFYDKIIDSFFLSNYILSCEFFFFF